ncbi:50S ribosomal protein L17 [Chitinophaga sp. sic0106]|uniref:50S ribosomal protein L17 n=1 Tax=Chitinophaga sp. sic0106 TaxID=2854785 RepID=UPI001C45BE68|nr:50S ribosomal protein L17 [Chitinophaga sp. sic0106]MBV7533559.1 50S ribosomal protein L17 [Chitinophaga sp. sic0106]
MRHGVKLNKLSRTAAHRKSLMSNLACELISHKRITTTLAKAKALRVYVEPILTRGKADSTHNRRIVFSYLQDKEAIKELFGVISEKIANRPGGYTRIIKLGKRVGDNAEVAMIELVDFNEIYGKSAAADKAPAKKTRRAGGAKKKAEDEVAPAADASTEEKSAE